MKKALKSLLTIALAFVLAFSFTSVSAQAASKKITVAGVGKTKNVMAKFYKKAPNHKAKVTFNSMNLIGESNGYNIYYIDITLNNTKISQAEANGVSQQTRKYGLSQWNNYSLVFTNLAGQDVSKKVLLVSNESSVSTGEFKKKSNYRKGYYIYKDTVSYPKTKYFKMTIAVPQTETDIYVGVAGLKNGQMTSAKQSAYATGGITFNKAGFGGSNKNLAAMKIQ